MYWPYNKLNGNSVTLSQLNFLPIHVVQYTLGAYVIYFISHVILRAHVCAAQLEALSRCKSTSQSIGFYPTIELNGLGFLIDNDCDI